MKSTVQAKLPTIPQYFRQYVDSSVDLDSTPYQPCPFHQEQTGKSFSYSKKLGIWRCFGACHSGGDVVALHRLNYKLKSEEEALNSLCALYGIKNEAETPTFEREEVQVDKNRVHRLSLLAFANSLAKTTEDYLELDYIVSKVPFDTKELEVYCTVRGFPPRDNGSTSEV